ncbi:MAG: anaerobic ribonucleoside-triphosphate reductase activating protein [Rikenellaceae bacterium]
MLKFADYDIVFQELPSEVTLALNLSLCPNGCPGCHSAGLMEDIGEELTESALDNLVAKYLSSITAVCFMGGDNDKARVESLAEYIKTKYNLKVGWYSGQDAMPERPELFDYVKLGPYCEALGSLKEPTTNQRLYKYEGSEWVDITSVFWK